MIIKLIIDYDISGFFFVVFVADFIRDDIAHLYRAKDTCSFVGSNFLLVRRFRNRVFHLIQSEFMVIAYLHGGSIPAIHDLAWTSRFLRAGQDFHTQRNRAFVARVHVLQSPGYGSIGVYTAVAGRDEFHILIQRILDDDIRFLFLVIPEADFVGNDVSDLHSAKRTRAFVWFCLFLFRFFRHRILHGLQCKFVVISDLDGCSVSAVYNLTRSILGFKRAFQHLYRQCHGAFLARFHFRQCPGHHSVYVLSAIAC